MFKLTIAQTYKGKKVLITGNTGFKGSWLSITLLELGAEVYGYALEPISNQDNFVTCNLESKYKQVYADIRDKEKLLKTFREIEPEIVFHLAAQPLVLESYFNPVETFDVNIMGTVNLLEAVKQCESVKVAINVTSDKCYDNKEWIWGYRENEAMGGKDPYSASKGCSELITASYIQSFFSDKNSCLVATARAGNVIGGGDWAENRIVPDFFKAFQKNQTLNIRNPHATRPWQFVLEPLFGYITLAAELLKKGKTLQGGWNFGPLSNTHKTVGDLIQTIQENPVYKSVNINYTQPDFHEASFLKLDITKATTQLSWKPLLSFEQTMQFTIDGYSYELDKENNVYDKRVNQLKAYMQLA